MKVNSKKPKLCKDCKQEFKQYTTIQNRCVDCQIKRSTEKNLAEAENFLVKGTEAFKKAKVEVKIGENRNELQRNINLLSRKIDEKFGYITCIDCGKPFGNQIDAAHFHDMSTHRGIRFNLDNLHSSRSDCNQYSSKHKVGYAIGLEERYGKEYLDFVKDLENNTKELKLNAIEIAEKLALVRKLIRTFDSLQFENSLIARKQLNTIIGIYL